MRKTAFLVGTLMLLAPLAIVHAQGRQHDPSAQDSLDIYFIDTEGGQATLFVPSSGETLLMDTGTGGDHNIQAERIWSAIKEAGVQQLDYVIVSHYHGDHVGNAAELANRLPIRHFIDHGAYSVELQPGRSAAFSAYMEVRAKAHASVAEPCEKIPIAGLDVTVVSSAGDLLKGPLAGAPGAGVPNPACREFTAKKQDPTPENFESVGIVVRFGSFRLLDLADLTWNQENDLVCPNNLLGTFDVYHTTRHGTEWSGSPELVHGVRARVAVMNNGPKKGGTEVAWDIIHATPGFQDLWQLHYSELVDKKHNPPNDFVASLDEVDHGYEFKMTVHPDGSFSMKNTRNGFTKEYAALAKK